MMQNQDFWGVDLYWNSPVTKKQVKPQYMKQDQDFFHRGCACL